MAPRIFYKILPQTNCRQKPSVPLKNLANNEKFSLQKGKINTNVMRFCDDVKC